MDVEIRGKMKKLCFQMFLELIPWLVNHASGGLIAFLNLLFWRCALVGLSMPTEAQRKPDIKGVKNDIYGHDEQPK